MHALDAVHFGHHVIHKDNIIFGIERKIEGLYAAQSSIQLDLGIS